MVVVIKIHSGGQNWLTVDGRLKSSKPIASAVHFELVLRNNPRLTNDNDNDQRKQALAVYFLEQPRDPATNPLRVPS